MSTKVCGDPKHWENILIWDYCWRCNQELAPFIPKEELPHKPLTEAEVDGMFAEQERSAQTESEAWRGAH